MIFKETIHGWDSWGKVFTSIEAFAPLAKAIFQKEGINDSEKIQNLTPGSNAVFKADNLVIKIFAPPESGIDTEADYLTELAVLDFSAHNEVSVPKIIAYGAFADKYLFRYIIMEYIYADVSIDELLAFPVAKKKEFVRQLKAITDSMHQPFQNLPKTLDLKNQNIRIERMKGLCPSLIRELTICAQTQDFPNMVLVHGDITRDNLLLSSNGTLTLIDFADCLIAPDYYELPAIIFEIFLCDPELVLEYIGALDQELFLEMLMKGLSLHLCCGFVLRDYFTRLDIPLDSVSCIEELKQRLRKQLFI